MKYKRSSNFNEVEQLQSGGRPSDGQSVKSRLTNAPEIYRKATFTRRKPFDLEGRRSSSWSNWAASTLRHNLGGQTSDNLTSLQRNLFVQPPVVNPFLGDWGRRCCCSGNSYKKLSVIKEVKTINKAWTKQWLRNSSGPDAANVCLSLTHTVTQWVTLYRNTSSEVCVCVCEAKHTWEADDSTHNAGLSHKGVVVQPDHCHDAQLIHLVIDTECLQTRRHNHTSSRAVNSPECGRLATMGAVD